MAAAEFSKINAVHFSGKKPFDADILSDKNSPMVFKPYVPKRLRIKDKFLFNHISEKDCRYCSVGNVTCHCDGELNQKQDQLKTKLNKNKETTQKARNKKVIGNNSSSTITSSSKTKTSTKTSTYASSTVISATDMSMKTELLKRKLKEPLVVLNKLQYFEDKKDTEKQKLYSTDDNKNEETNKQEKKAYNIGTNYVSQKADDTSSLNQSIDFELDHVERKTNKRLNGISKEVENEKEIGIIGNNECNNMSSDESDTFSLDEDTSNTFMQTKVADNEKNITDLPIHNTAPQSVSNVQTICRNIADNNKQKEKFESVFILSKENVVPERANQENTIVENELFDGFNLNSDFYLDQNVNEIVNEIVNDLPNIVITQDNVIESTLDSTSTSDNLTSTNAVVNNPATINVDTEDATSTDAVLNNLTSKNEIPNSTISNNHIYVNKTSNNTTAPVHLMANSIMLVDSVTNNAYSNDSMNGYSEIFVNKNVNGVIENENIQDSSSSNKKDEISPCVEKVIQTNAQKNEDSNVEIDYENTETAVISTNSSENVSIVEDIGNSSDHIIQNNVAATLPMGNVEQGVAFNCCDNCMVLQKEIDSLKKQSVINLQIFKQKIIPSSELIAEFHKKLQVLERKNKTIKELQDKLESCFSESAMLRLKLDNALDANLPLRKSISQLRKKSEAKDFTFSDMKKQLELAKDMVASLRSQLGEYKAVSENSSKDKAEVVKQKDEESKKVKKQSTLIEKLNSKLKTANERSRKEKNFARKLSREKDKWLKEKENARKEIEMLKKMNSEMLKQIKKSGNNVNFMSKFHISNKSSKTPQAKRLSKPITDISPSSMLSPSPSSEDEVSKMEQIGDELSSSSSSESSSSTESDVNDETLPSKNVEEKLQHLLGNILDYRNRKPTNRRLASTQYILPTLSPIPPSPKGLQVTEKNTAKLTKQSPVRKSKRNRKVLSKALISTSESERETGLKSARKINVNPDENETLFIPIPVIIASHESNENVENNLMIQQAITHPEKNLELIVDDNTMSSNKTDSIVQDVERLMDEILLNVENSFKLPTEKPLDFGAESSLYRDHDNILPSFSNNVDLNEIDFDMGGSTSSHSEQHDRMNSFVEDLMMSDDDSDSNAPIVVAKKNDDKENTTADVQISIVVNEAKVTYQNILPKADNSSEALYELTSISQSLSSSSKTVNGKDRSDSSIQNSHSTFKANNSFITVNSQKSTSRRHSTGQMKREDISSPRFFNISKKPRSRSFGDGSIRDSTNKNITSMFKQNPSSSSFKSDKSAFTATSLPDNMDRLTADSFPDRSYQFTRASSLNPPNQTSNPLYQPSSPDHSSHSMTISSPDPLNQCTTTSLVDRPCQSIISPDPIFQPTKTLQDHRGQRKTGCSMNFRNIGTTILQESLEDSIRKSSKLKNSDAESIVENQTGKSTRNCSVYEGASTAASHSSSIHDVSSINIPMMSTVSHNESLDTTHDENDSEVASLSLLSTKVAHQAAQVSRQTNQVSFQTAALSDQITRHQGNQTNNPARLSSARRRHTIPSSSYRDVVPNRIERTRSFSPTMFLSPSPPISPLPPSPPRSTLTPIISPLPTTPLPESVSPLPLSPKIASPPLIRESALAGNGNVYAPKPLSVNNRYKAAKMITFNSSSNNQAKGNSTVSKRIAHRPTSSSNTSPDDMQPFRAALSNHLISNTVNLSDKSMEQNNVNIKQSSTAIPSSSQVSFAGKKRSRIDSKQDSEPVVKKSRSTEIISNSGKIITKTSKGSGLAGLQHHQTRERHATVKKGGTPSNYLPVKSTSRLITYERVSDIPGRQATTKENIATNICASNNKSKKEINSTDKVENETRNISRKNINKKSSILVQPPTKNIDRENKDIEIPKLNAIGNYRENTSVNRLKRRAITTVEQSSESEQDLTIDIGVGAIVKSKKIFQRNSANKNDIDEREKDNDDANKDTATVKTVETRECFKSKATVEQHISKKIWESSTGFVIRLLMSDVVHHETSLHSLVKYKVTPFDAVKAFVATVRKCDQYIDINSILTKHADKNNPESSENEAAFHKCHSKSHTLSTPVLSDRETVLISIVKYLCANEKYARVLPMLVSQLKLSVMTIRDDAIMLERMALWRFYAACCRLQNNFNELMSSLIGVFEDDNSKVNISCLFVTVYTVWPCITLRTDLLKLYRDKSLDLNRVKLSPLSAVMQLVSLVESVRNKEVTIAKTIGNILGGLEINKDLLNESYYEPMIHELLDILCNTELVYLETDTDDIKLCDYGNSTIRAVKIICRFSDWEWTYNEFISKLIWEKADGWSRNDDINDTTFAVLIMLLGQLMLMGCLSGFYGFQEIFEFLKKLLHKVIEDVAVSRFVPLSILNALLDIAPVVSHRRNVYKEISNGFTCAENKGIMLPGRLRNKLSDLLSTL